MVAEPKDLRILEGKYCSWNCDTDNKFKYVKFDFYNEKNKTENIELIENVSEVIQRNESPNLIFE